MRSVTAVILIAVILAAQAGRVTAAPEARLWERWTAHNPDSQATIDHSAWSAFLAQYVVHDAALDLNRLRYGAVTPADRQALADYLRRLQGADIAAYNRDVQLAYWINLYNAATVALILQHFPVESIRDIGGGFFGLGRDAWEIPVVTVDGVDLTLNDIEHRILRPIWDTPLIHYGVNCASVSCPNLLDRAYVAAAVYDQLQANAEDYVNSPRGARFTEGGLAVSSIYNWYQEDFGGSERTVISHLRRFAAPERSARLDAAEGIAAYYYDWSLNDAEGGAAG